MAQSADVTIVCAGLSSFLEGEEGEALLSPQNGDRESISLPASQVNYIKELAISGARIVLVLTGGSPIALGEVENLVDAILFVWYPGMEGGRAAADVLFGDISPSGKLPITFPKSLEQLPAFDDYNMQGRTYRFMTEEPLFPFGFGLSYARFAYENLRIVSPAISASGFEVEVTVKNVGEVAADEVVQFYLSALESRLRAPLNQLIGFQRTHLQPGQTTTVRLAITPEMLMLYNEDGRQVFEPGKFRLMAGGCSPSARGQALGTPAPAACEFQLA